MKKMKKAIAVLLTVALVGSALTGCGKKEDDVSSTNNDVGKGKVYFLNFKPESSTIWENIASTYTQETGVEVKVVTAASGTYEQTLRSEVAKKDAPTLFQINGPIGYQRWKEYCLDLKDTDFYSWLMDKSMAITDGSGVYGIPYVVEGYGIIYNDEIMQKYFSLQGKATDLSSVDEINNFDQLKAVVEDMSANKHALGIEGVFASTSFSAGEDWRWQTHLANLPIYYEFRDKGISDADEIDFSYSDNYKNIFDLYIQNSITDSKVLGSKTVQDSMAEFALGKVAMVQNGNWAWGDISGVTGNVVKEENVKFLPIYTGTKDDEKQSLCIGTENFFSVNSKATKEDQEATIAFIEWLYNTEKGKEFVVQELGFIAPFNTFTENEKPADPLAKEIIRYMEDETVQSVTWNFTAFPSQEFKDVFGASLLEYAQGKKEWSKVAEDMKADWASEKSMIQ